jgi:UDP-N-acetylmuramyl pentapeptide phosphotransferase/UDP-N-acetylglucosamine-1-phosphate transferase
MNTVSLILILFAMAAAACCIANFPVIGFLRKRQVLDRPNERSSHVVPTPRGGGLAIISVLIPGLLLLGAFASEPSAILLAVCGLMLAGISFVDDLKPIRPSVRFSIHLLAAAVLMVGLWFWKDANAAMFTGPGSSSALRVGLGLVLCIYLVGYANAFNFMDGINGISGVQAFISGTGIALVALLLDPVKLRTVAMAGAILAGTAVGFLPHNFPRARVFMGDVGSVPLGFISAGLGVVITWKEGLWLIVPLALLHTNYILDTAITLTRRVLCGEKWYLPHREHFYQRLVRSGKSHPFVTGWEATLQLVTLSAVVAYLNFGTLGRAITIGGVIVLWLGFFTWAEARFRATQRQSGTVQPLSSTASRS